jgi:GNAT superfamily N-acetyltransferase
MEYNFDGLKFNIIRNDKAYYPSILKLYKETSNYKKDLNFVERKYNTSIYGPTNIGFLAFDGDQVASYYGVFPIKMVYKNVEYLAAQSGDTLTHPNYQMKGLFTHLAKEAYEVAKKENIHFVYGFPNKNSIHGLQRKLNWVFHHKMQEFSISVNSLPVGELLSKINFFNGVYLTWVNKLLRKDMVNPNEVGLEGFNTQQNYLRVKKDLDFFSYKKYDNATLISRNSFLIYLKVETHLIIGDVAFFEKQRFPEFISTIKQIARKLLVFKIKFYLSQNHWLFVYLKEQFQPIENNPIGFCFFNQNCILPVEDALFSAADFDTF